MFGLDAFMDEVKTMRAQLTHILAGIHALNQEMRSVHREMAKQTAYLALIAHQGEGAVREDDDDDSKTVAG